MEAGARSSSGTDAASVTASGSLRIVLMGRQTCHFHLLTAALFPFTNNWESNICKALNQILLAVLTLMIWYRRLTSSSASSGNSRLSSNSAPS